MKKKGQGDVLMAGCKYTEKVEKWAFLRQRYLEGRTGIHLQIIRYTVRSEVRMKRRQWMVFMMETEYIEYVLCLPLKGNMPLRLEAVSQMKFTRAPSRQKSQPTETMAR